MSNRVSVAIIAGLSVICIGLYLNNSQKNAEKVPVEEIAKSKDGRNTISLSIYEDESFTADEFKTTFRIVQKDKEKNRAFNLLNESREKVVSLLENLHVAKSDYEMRTMSLDKDYDYSGKQRMLIGYSASQNVEIRFLNKAKSEEVERELATLDFVDDLETIGGLRNADSLEIETIRRACKKVQKRSEVYAQSVGTEAGTVLAVEGNSSVDEMNRYSDSVGVSARLKVSVQLRGGENPKQAYVQVSQYESKKFPADLFIVSAGAVMSGEDKEKIYSQVGMIKDSIVALSKNLGVAESEINVHAAKVGLKKRWEFEDGESKKNRFRARQFVTVSFASKRDAAAFLVVMASAQNVTVGDVRSVLKNQDSLEVFVTNIAGQKAMARAKAIAEGLDGTLGEVVYVGDNVSDDYSIVNEISYESRARGKTVLGNNRAISDISSDMLAGLLGGGGAEGLIADSVEVDARVNVIAKFTK